jgi:hypothetical protein
VDSLPPPPGRDSEAFVTGGAYAMLFLAGALQALVGTFQYSRTVGTFPLTALFFALLILVTCLLGAAGMRSVAGALVPAIGWFVVTLVLSMPTSGGSVILASTTPGQWYLYGGSLGAVAGVVIALVRLGRQRAWARALPRHQGS